MHVRWLDTLHYGTKCLGAWPVNCDTMLIALIKIARSLAILCDIETAAESVDETACSDRCKLSWMSMSFDNGIVAVAVGAADGTMCMAIVPGKAPWVTCKEG